MEDDSNLFNKARNAQRLERFKNLFRAGNTAAGNYSPALTTKAPGAQARAKGYSKPAEGKQADRLSGQVDKSRPMQRVVGERASPPSPTRFERASSRINSFAAANTSSVNRPHAPPTYDGINARNSISNELLQKMGSWLYSTIAKDRSLPRQVYTSDTIWLLGKAFPFDEAGGEINLIRDRPKRASSIFNFNPWGDEDRLSVSNKRHSMLNLPALQSPIPPGNSSPPMDLTRPKLPRSHSASHEQVLTQSRTSSTSPHRFTMDQSHRSSSPSRLASPTKEDSNIQEEASIDTSRTSTPGTVAHVVYPHRFRAVSLTSKATSYGQPASTQDTVYSSPPLQSPTSSRYLFRHQGKPLPSSPLTSTQRIDIWGASSPVSAREMSGGTQSRSDSHSPSPSKSTPILEAMAKVDYTQAGDVRSTFIPSEPGTKAAGARHSLNNGLHTDTKRASLFNPETVDQGEEHAGSWSGDEEWQRARIAIPVEAEDTNEKANGNAALISNSSGIQALETTFSSASLSSDITSDFENGPGGSRRETWHMFSDEATDADEGDDIVSLTDSIQGKRVSNVDKLADATGFSFDSSCSDSTGSTAMRTRTIDIPYSHSVSSDASDLITVGVTAEKLASSNHVKLSSLGSSSISSEIPVKAADDSQQGMSPNQLHIHLEAPNTPRISSAEGTKVAADADTTNTSLWISSLEVTPSSSRRPSGDSDQLSLSSFNLPFETMSSVSRPNSPFSGTNSSDLSNNQLQLVQFIQDFQSLAAFSYRKDFSRFMQTYLTSDAGWGCMHRCCQSLLCNAMLIRTFGRDHGKIRKDDPRWRRYVEIISLFMDDPSPEAGFSIYKLVEAGKLYGTNVAEWFGPTITAKVIELLATEISLDLAICVCSDAAVYKSDVMQYLQSHDGSLQPTLLLIATRLGLETINPVYYPSIQACFKLKQSVGIAGGRPNSAMYFCGCQGDDVLCIDPHTTKPALGVKPRDMYTESDLATFHLEGPNCVHITQLDPSMLIGFLILDIQDFDDFCVSFQRVFGSLKPIFTIEEYPLLYTDDNWCNNEAVMLESDDSL
ncbi:hypothetical protein BZG36_04138 [Bifiguratus adelaidae]|uniref:Autophagy-related protein 4 n=1 Tax=Bifiguratus adelaidae TaxID=1938954 RepID=A0A261XVX5_9FUNG|nr:hypothetical protein BZG36_04138 [Bifiguratus adelaidae]